MLRIFFLVVIPLPFISYAATNCEYFTVSEVTSIYNGGYFRVSINGNPTIVGKGIIFSMADTNEPRS